MEINELENNYGMFANMFDEVVDNYYDVNGFDNLFESKCQSSGLIMD